MAYISETRKLPTCFFIMIYGGRRALLSESCCWQDLSRLTSCVSKSVSYMTLVAETPLMIGKKGDWSVIVCPLCLGRSATLSILR
jgi:hypothetical protein